MKSIYHKNKELVKFKKIYVPRTYLPHLRIEDGESSYAFSLSNNLFKTEEYYNTDEYFSENHDAYQEGYTFESRKEKYKGDITNVTKYIVENKVSRYADLGSGPGFYAAAIKEQLPKVKVYAVDPCKYIAKEAKRFRVKRVQSFLQEIKLKKDLLDIATSHHTLEHIEADEIGTALVEIKRIIKNKGLFYAIIPTIDSPRVVNNQEVQRQIIDDETYRTLATRKWWEEQFEKVGGFKKNKELEKHFDRKGYGWVFVYNIEKK